MISNLSSLIQLFAGIFLTMCLDNKVLRRFWTKDNPDRITVAFENLKMPEEVKPFAKTPTESLSKSFENRTTKRGTLMFILSVFLLIVIGFEKGIATHTGYLGLSCSYILFAIATVIYFMCDRSIMKEWLVGYRNIFYLLVGYFFLIIVVPFFPWYRPWGMQFSLWLKIIAKVCIVIAIILPVVWSLFVNWLYSKYYLNYVVSEVTTEIDDYNLALNYDPSYNHIDEIKPYYRDLAIKHFTTKNDAPLLEVFKKRISNVKFYPTIFPLIGISLKERRRMIAESREGKE